MSSDMDLSTEQKDEIISGLDLSTLFGKRILVCGKGGCGKSTVVTLLARAFARLNISVVAIDGDSSNPGGLSRLLFGSGDDVKPLIEFFGGREAVGCPVDDPSILTRLNDKSPLTEKNISLEEIPNEYQIKENGITLFQVGKIKQPYEGCDGPMSKITRDFIISDSVVTIIDIEAGIEHYGRGIEKNVDLVVVVIDPTFESLLIAHKIAILCERMNIRRYGTIINKISSDEIKTHLEEELAARGLKIFGYIKNNSEIFDAGLRGSKMKLNFEDQELKQILKNIVSDFRSIKSRDKQSLMK